jgi:hypothetical protein
MITFRSNRVLSLTFFRHSFKKHVLSLLLLLPVWALGTRYSTPLPGFQASEGDQEMNRTINIEIENEKNALNLGKN